MNFIGKLVLAAAILAAGAAVALTDAIGSFSDVAMVITLGGSILVFAFEIWEWLATRGRRSVNHLRLKWQHLRRRRNRRARSARKQQREFEMRVRNGELVNLGR